MSFIIPVAAVANQSLNVTLDGQPVSLSIYTLPVPPHYYTLGQPNTYHETGIHYSLFMDVTYAGTVIKTCVQCVNLSRILAVTQYTAFVGDFIWVDTQGTDNPLYSGLGARWQLVYLEYSDVG